MENNINFLCAPSTAHKQDLEQQELSSLKVIT